MSLVAYGTSSDEESDCEDNEGSKAVIVQNTQSGKNIAQALVDKQEVSNCHISDDDDFVPEYIEQEKHFTSLSKVLPKPKIESNIADILEHFSKSTFNALPAPKSLDTQIEIEEDDEFLHKKPTKEIIEKTKECLEVKKIPVKITIPSLTKFQDVEKELADKARDRNKFNQVKIAKTSGLLSLLPQAKSEQCFTKNMTTSITKNEPNVISTIKPAAPSFIPDSVKHHRPATNTEDVDKCKITRKSSKNQINKVSTQSDMKVDTDESDDDHSGDDFFSFNTDHSLPEVSAREINSLVAKKTAKIIETSSKFLETIEAQKSLREADMEICEQDLVSSRKRYHEQQTLNSEALQALVGGSTKRRRQQSSIQVIELNSSQVMPNKDEWMRTALASSTSYQPTGVLVDEEPASGTRRKHQITYLAHKAKANEAELQAMWSSNRQNRRATQSKYGF